MVIVLNGVVLSAPEGQVLSYADVCKLGKLDPKYNPSISYHRGERNSSGTLTPGSCFKITDTMEPSKATVVNACYTGSS